LSVLDHLSKRHPGVHVVVLTAVSDVASIVRAVRHGAVGRLSKTEPADRVVQVVRHVAGRGGWIPPDVLGDVLREFAGGEPDPGGPPELAGLTKREREVLQCMVDGLSRNEIAERLGLSANTVRTHTQNLLAKLDLHSALEAITLAMRTGMRTGDGGPR
jgi:DNA-binding NarL/FixJ family response regulator